MVTAPIPFRLSRPAALRLVHEIAQDSSRVILTTHAKRRMRERRITLPQVISCLLKGQLTEDPSMDAYGNWVCSLRWRHAGDYLRVAAAIKQDSNTGKKVVIITVMYED